MRDVKSYKQIELKEVLIKFLVSVFPIVVGLAFATSYMDYIPLYYGTFGYTIALAGFFFLIVSLLLHVFKKNNFSKFVAIVALFYIIAGLLIIVYDIYYPQYSPELN